MVAKKNRSKKKTSHIKSQDLTKTIQLKVLKDEDIKEYLEKKNEIKESTVSTANEELHKHRKRYRKRKSNNIQNVLPKKEEFFVLEGNQLKKPIKEPFNICKVLAPLFKRKHKKVYNKEERKEIVECDEYSNLKFEKYKSKKYYMWPLVFIKNRFKVMIFDMARLKKRLKYGTFRDKILIIIMVFLILCCLLGILFVGYVIINAPEISKDALYATSSTVLYDADGNEFARLGAQNREVVTYDQLPEVLVDAIVATEDSRFFQHNGIDLARFTKAVIGQLMGRSDAGGGSTLTMQVSKNVATSTVDSGIQGIIRKFTDIYLSVFVLEKQYTKEDILEFYVNIPFLGTAYGVEQASQSYFGKSVSELTLPEAAMIAGLFQAPSSYNPYNYPERADSRKNQVLNLMKRHGYITEEECEAAKAVPISDLLAGSSGNTGVNKYVGFVDTVVSEVIDRTGNDPYTTSMNIYTTMRVDKQDAVNDIMNGVTYTWKNDYAQAGIAVLDVKSGAIIAIGAGRNKTTERSYNYATQINRHPGSTAKPVIDYGPAIEYLGWGTSQTIIDEKYGYSTGGTIKNWDSSFKGIETIEKALAQSRNVPALLTFQQTTNEQKKEFANGLGWYPTEDGNGNILETTSIGGFNGVNPVQSAAAYGAFARGGTYIEPYSFTSIEYTDSDETYTVTPKKKDVMSEGTAYLITMILKYAVDSGNVNVGSKVSGTDLAGKTGTSSVDAAVKKNLGITADLIGDSWENVYSPDYVISTWYGYNEVTKDHYLTNTEGGNARRAITKQLVKTIFETNSKFTKPDTVEEVEIELETDPIQRPSAYTPSDLREVSYFTEGTAPDEDDISERFAQLSDASGLKATKNGSSVTLTWKAAETPNAISEEWLTDYFTSSKIYKPFFDQYYQRRINYNNSVFGTFGYRVYQTTSSGTTEIGFTDKTTMTVNPPAGDVTYTVKTSYQNFSSNQSNGITAKIEGDAYNISYKGSSCVSSFDSSGSSSSKVTVTKNGSTISDLSSNGLSVTVSCYDANGTSTSCQSVNDGETYSVKFALVNSSNTTIASTSIRVSGTC